MSRGKAWVDRRGITLAAIVGTMLAAGQTGTVIARADAPVDVSVPDVTVAEANDPSGAVLEGGSITYTLTITNEGDGEAAAVQVRDRLPAGVTLADATAGCDEAAGLVTCALGEIGAHASLEANITVTVDQAFCGAIVNSADVSASNEDGEAVGNNASNELSNHVACDEPAPSVPQPSAGPDLQVSTGSDAGGILHDGDDVLYTITVTNVGDEVATGVELVDVLPSGAVNVAVPPFPTLAGRACAVTSSVPPGGGVPSAEVRCGPLSLGPDASSSVTIRVIVGGDVCGLVTNVADVGGANEPAENIGHDNHAETTDEIACVPRIRLLQRGPSLAHVGDQITYAFWAKNTGDVDLSNIDITVAGCDSSPALIEDGNGDEILSVDEEWRFGCDRTITGADGDPARNHAMVAGDHESRAVSDSVTHDVNVIHPSIDLESTPRPLSGPAGTVVVFSYAVTNTGDTNLFAVAISDADGDRVDQIATLPAGRTVRLTRRITLHSSPITEVTTVEGSDVLGAVVSDTDDATVTVVASGGGSGTAGGNPFTGSDTDALAGWIVALAGLGSALLLISRGRSESSLRPSRTSESS